jgi:ABC-type transport system involved in cytochrome bd biosynthesis fused ATPase/permease subunit
MAEGTDSNQSADIVQSFVEIQKTELALREQELRIARSEEQHKYEYACKVVEANKEDRRESRTTGVRTLKMALIFTFSVIFVLTAFSALAVWKGHADLVKDIAQGLLIFTGGAGSGFAFGYSRGKKECAKSEVRK